MQMPYINYLHHASKFCSGYEKYLQKRSMGINSLFNWGYALTTVFWLSYHRMYKEMSISLFFYCLIIFYLSKGILTAESAGIILLVTYFIGCFYFYYFYEQAMNSKLRPNDIEPYKKIRPFNFFISLGIFVSLAILNITIFSLILKIFL